MIWLDRTTIYFVEFVGFWYRSQLISGAIQIVSLFSLKSIYE
jgi:hypothetical protein